MIQQDLDLFAVPSFIDGVGDDIGPALVLVGVANDEDRIFLQVVLPDTIQHLTQAEDVVNFDLLFRV